MSRRFQNATRAEIDLSAVADNIRAIRVRVGPRVKIMPAVKANGYGHGAVQTSLACLDGGADVLCVANIEEAIELREAGIDVPVIILGCSTCEAVESILDYGVIATVCDPDFARCLSGAATGRGMKSLVHIKVDTGMGRIGVPGGSVVEFAQTVAGLPGLQIDGVFTHFPSSDEEDRSFTLSQISVFEGILDELRRQGIRVPLAHASNSGGILAFPQADFDAVRPGIMIYGLYPSLAAPRSIPLREALTLKSVIVFLKEAEVGTTISYGRTHTLTRRSKVATIPVGYADGYLRAFSSRGEAAVRGMRVPVIGRVCMDQCVIDVTDVPGVAVGDEVILYGGGFDFLNLTHIAERLGTIPNELLCALSKRVPRVYT